MPHGFLRTALLAGVFAFAAPVGLMAQENGDTSDTPQSQAGPDVNTQTAGDQPAVVPSQDEKGCPTGSLDTDEAGTAATATAAGTDADLTNCAENEPADNADAEQSGQGQGGSGDGAGGAGGTGEQGSDDSGTNTGG